jgi:hypothetical protein
MHRYLPDKLTMADARSRHDDTRILRCAVRCAVRRRDDWLRDCWSTRERQQALTAPINCVERSVYSASGVLR